MSRNTHMLYKHKRSISDHEQRLVKLEQVSSYRRCEIAKLWHLLEQMTADLKELEQWAESQGLRGPLQ